MKRLVIILFFVSLCYGTPFVLLDTTYADVYTSHQKPNTDSTLDLGSIVLLWRYIYGDSFTDGTALWDDSRLTGFDHIASITFTDGVLTITGGDITDGEWRGTEVDISEFTNLIAGINITLDGDTLNVDDVFLRNDGDDTTTGTITAVEFIGDVTAGTVIADTVTGGSSTFGDGGTTNYIEITEDGAMILHGDARVEKHIDIGAASWKRGVTAPTETYENIFPTISFNTGQDDEAHYTTMVPLAWDNTTDMEVHIRWQMPNAADNGNVFWKLKYISVGTGEDPAGAGTEITQLSAGNHPQDELIDTVFTTKILAANLERADDLGLMLWRHGTDVSDDCGEDAELIALHIHYIINQMGKIIGIDVMIYEDDNVMIYEDGNTMIFE